MIDHYKTLIDRWIGKIPSRATFEFVMSKTVQDILEESLGGIPEIFTQADLRTLGWVYCMNSEIKDRYEKLDTKKIKSDQRSRADEWFIRGDSETVLPYYGALDKQAIAGARWKLANISAVISTPIVGAILYSGYKRLDDLIDPVIRRAKDVEFAVGEDFGPMPSSLAKLIRLQSNIVAKMNVISEQAFDAQFWMGQSIQGFGKFNIQEAPYGVAPGGFLKLKALIAGYMTDLLLAAEGRKTVLEYEESMS